MKLQRTEKEWNERGEDFFNVILDVVLPDRSIEMDD